MVEVCELVKTRSGLHVLKETRSLGFHLLPPNERHRDAPDRSYGSIDWRLSVPWQRQNCEQVLSPTQGGLNHSCRSVRNTSDAMNQKIFVQSASRISRVIVSQPVITCQLQGAPMDEFKFNRGGRPPLHGIHTPDLPVCQAET
jgi:hypothetical protein